MPQGVAMAAAFAQKYGGGANWCSVPRAVLRHQLTDDSSPWRGGRAPAREGGRDTGHVVPGVPRGRFPGRY